jgi:hypothetical protein
VSDADASPQGDVVDEDIDDVEDDLDGDVEYEQGDANRVTGTLARNVLDYVARQIVDDPDSVEVELDEHRGRVELRLHVAPDDMGKVIGKRGRVAQAVRALVRAAGAQEGIDANVDIVD